MINLYASPKVPIEKVFPSTKKVSYPTYLLGRDYNRGLTKGLDPVLDFVNETLCQTPPRPKDDGNHLFDRSQLTFPIFYQACFLKPSPTQSTQRLARESL